MAKLVMVLTFAAMVAHLIRPFGLPGLKRRLDVWKLALAAFALVALVAVLRPEGEPPGPQALTMVPPFGCSTCPVM